MKLDRNIPGNEGRGKYALLHLRKLALYTPAETFGRNAVMQAVAVLDEAGLIDWGNHETSEFFVIRLKDRCASAALSAYARVAGLFDQEYAGEVRDLAARAGPYHPDCKIPD